MEQTIIAAAQSIPFKGEVARNIEAHGNIIDIAHSYDVQLIVFPELSLTGYEPGTLMVAKFCTVKLFKSNDFMF